MITCLHYLGRFVIKFSLCHIFTCCHLHRVHKRYMYNIYEVYFTCFGLYEHVWESQLEKGGSFTAFFSLLANFLNFVPNFRYLLNAIFCMIIVLGVGYVSLKY